MFLYLFIWHMKPSLLLQGFAVSFAPWQWFSNSVDTLTYKTDSFSTCCTTCSSDGPKGCTADVQKQDTCRFDRTRRFTRREKEADLTGIRQTWKRTWLHVLSEAKKKQKKTGTCYKWRHGNWLKYYLLYRMFCVAETLLFPFGHFVITCVSQKILYVLIIKYDFLNVWTILFHGHVYIN